jgi:hypothetical protein
VFVRALIRTLKQRLQQGPSEDYENKVAGAVAASLDFFTDAKRLWPCLVPQLRQ